MSGADGDIPPKAMSRGGLVDCLRKANFGFAEPVVAPDEGAKAARSLKVVRVAMPVQLIRANRNAIHLGPSKGVSVHLH